MAAHRDQPLTSEEAARVAGVLTGHDYILIVSHRRPDGDCLGSSLALLAGLESFGKTVSAYNPSVIPRGMQFLPGIEKIQPHLPAWTPNVTVFLDCGGVDRVEDDFAPAGLVINIDHHASNDRFGDVHYIDTGATAVGEQVFHVLQELGAVLTPQIATALYVAIATDSGGFRYANTSEQTFQVAGALVRAGADPAKISVELFESQSPEEVLLRTRCLSRHKLECGGKLCWSELRNEDYADANGRENEPEGLSSELRGILGVELAILLHEMEDGACRASFRAKSHANCAELASQFGGGGHQAAAGCTVNEADYETNRDRIVAASREYLETLLAQKG